MQSPNASNIRINSFIEDAIFNCELNCLGWMLSLIIFSLFLKITFQIYMFLVWYRIDVLKKLTLWKWCYIIRISSNYHMIKIMQDVAMSSNIEHCKFKYSFDTEMKKKKTVYHSFETHSSPNGPWYKNNWEELFYY